jgi:hypothetical protein
MKVTGSMAGDLMGLLLILGILYLGWSIAVGIEKIITY